MWWLREGLDRILVFRHHLESLNNLSINQGWKKQHIKYLKPKNGNREILFRFEVSLKFLSLSRLQQCGNFLSVSYLIHSAIKSILIRKTLSPTVYRTRETIGYLRKVQTRSGPCGFRNRFFTLIDVLIAQLNRWWNEII